MELHRVAPQWFTMRVVSNICENVAHIVCVVEERIKCWIFSFSFLSLSHTLLQVNNKKSTMTTVQSNIEYRTVA